MVSAAELAPEAAQADIRASHVDPAARAARWFSQPLFDDVLADAAASAVTAGKKKRAAPVVHDSDDEEEEEEEAPAAPRARAGMTLSTLDAPGSMSTLRGGLRMWVWLGGKVMMYGVMWHRTCFVLEHAGACSTADWNPYCFMLRSLLKKGHPKPRKDGGVHCVGGVHTCITPASHLCAYLPI